VNSRKDLSATWVQINNGGGEHKDMIGAGIEVNPSFSGDTFVRFHIGWVMHKNFFRYILLSSSNKN
jgi:hypothetical protein